MYFDSTPMGLRQMRMDAKIKRIYAEASQDIQEKIDKYSKRFKALDADWQQRVKEGKATKGEYDTWKAGQVFIGKRWESVRDDILQQIHNSNETASRIINGEKRAIFVEAVNHAEYSIDKDYRFGISFNLYDSATLTRILRDDPQILPEVSTDPDRDYVWGRKQITSAITQGFIQGESIPDIGKRIGEKLGSSSQKHMQRLARTAMNSAQNAGRIEAMYNAKEMGIKVQKLWIATLDNRTRDSHQDLDGQVQDVDKPFESMLGDILFPGDPDADPANVWNCRCALGYEYPEYKNQYDERGAKNDDGEDEIIPYMTYKEWRNWKATGQLPQKNVPVVLTPAEKLKKMLETGNADIYEAGKIFAGIIHDQIEDFKKSNHVDEAKARLEEIEFDYSSNTVFEGVKQLQAFIRGFGGSYEEIIEMLKGADLGINYDNIDKFDLLNILREKRDAINDEKIRLKKIVDSGTPKFYESAKILKTALSEYREMGSDGLNIHEHLQKSRSPVRKFVEDAYSFYPKDWVEKSVNRGTLKPMKVSRGYYDDYDQVIAISSYNGDNGSFETAVHELGHRFERAVPQIRDEEEVFYKRRTAGEELKWLGQGYDRTEVSRKDDFINAYMGKDYGGHAYELVSMGFEYAYTDPERLSKDSDMESWIYGLLLTK